MCPSVMARTAMIYNPTIPLLTAKQPLESSSAVKGAYPYTEAKEEEGARSGHKPTASRQCSAVGRGHNLATKERRWRRRQEEEGARSGHKTDCISAELCSRSWSLSGSKEKEVEDVKSGRKTDCHSAELGSQLWSQQWMINILQHSLASVR